MDKTIKKVKTCCVCGKSFYITSASQNSKRYCSEECKKQNSRKKQKEWRSEHMSFKPKTKICPICGKDFIIENASSSKKVYCSLECRNKQRVMRLAAEAEKRKKSKKDKDKNNKNNKKITRLYTPFKCGGMSIEEISIKAAKKRMTYGQYSSKFYDIPHVEKPFMFGEEEKKYNYVKFKWKKSEGRKQ